MSTLVAPPCSMILHSLWRLSRKCLLSTCGQGQPARPTTPCDAPSAKIPSAEKSSTLQTLRQQALFQTKRGQSSPSDEDCEEPMYCSWATQKTEKCASSSPVFGEGDWKCGCALVELGWPPDDPQPIESGTKAGHTQKHTHTHQHGGRNQRVYHRKGAGNSFVLAPGLGFRCGGSRVLLLLFEECPTTMSPSGH